MSTEPLGKRFNKGKTLFHLVPLEITEAFAKVSMFGMQNHEKFNWLKGLSWNETLDSLERHRRAFVAGENYDAESGHLHLAHMLWNTAALLVFARRGLGIDDRREIYGGEIDSGPQAMPLQKIDDRPSEIIARTLSNMKVENAAILQDMTYGIAEDALR